MWDFRTTLSKKLFYCNIRMMSPFCALLLLWHLLIIDDTQGRWNSTLFAQCILLFQGNPPFTPPITLSHTHHFSCSKGLNLHLTRFLATEGWMQVFVLKSSQASCIGVVAQHFPLLFLWYWKSFQHTLRVRGYTVFKSMPLPWPFPFSAHKTDCYL